MASDSSEVRVRRVVVGLDSRRRPALDGAAEVAEALEAELLGVFVEDPELLAFARLPFAREVGFTSAAHRALDRAAMERSLRALAAQMERACAAAMERTSVPWSFRSARGSLASGLLSAAAEDAQPTLLLPPQVLACPVVVRAGGEAREGLESLLQALHRAFGMAPAVLERPADEALLAELLEAGHPVLVFG